MPVRPPEFWRHDGWAAHLLAPLGLVYAAAGRWRRRRGAAFDPGVPVICVGNAVAGGAGKTPTAIAIVALLRGMGRRPHLLSRGYGGRLAGPVRVDPARHTAAEVGDEPLLLAAAAPAWVARDRAAGARAAVAAGADTLVLDDGFQNGALSQRLALLVLDGGAGVGNGRVHPAGPLREPWREAVARAAALVLVEPAGAAPRAPLPPLPAGLPLLCARLLPTPAALAFAGRRVFAFAGIGRPEKFFETLAELGAEVVGRIGFPDHHRYDVDETMRLVEQAAAARAEPVTTAKDWVRLPGQARAMVRPVPVELVFERPGEVEALLRRGLGR